MGAPERNGSVSFTTRRWGRPWHPAAMFPHFFYRVLPSFDLRRSNRPTGEAGNPPPPKKKNKRKSKENPTNTKEESIASFTVSLVFFVNSIEFRIVLPGFFGLVFFFGVVVRGPRRCFIFLLGGPRQ